MGFGSDSYLRQLISLLPKGRAWTRSLTSKMSELLAGFSPELARVDTYMESIITEKDTQFTDRLLPEFEIDYGLPDSCSDVDADKDTRRQDLRSRFLAVGRMDKQYYIDLALELGFNITITEFTPFWSGQGVSGDPCGDQDVLFFWQVNVSTSSELIIFRSGSGRSGDLLQSVAGISQVTCFFSKLKPAWTHILFNIIGPAYSRAYSSAFDSIPSDTPAFLEGAYSKAYSQAFDRRNGGAFDPLAYSIDYDKPA